MSVKHLLIIRHPETTANAEHRWIGRGETTFTQRGVEQMNALAREIVSFRPDAVWSSPLSRAQMPATQACDELGIEITVDSRLSELDFGEAEGLTMAEAQERGIEFDFTAEDHPVAPGGESRTDILLRSSEALHKALSSSERLVVVTHGGVVRSLLVDLLGLPISAIWAFDIRNAILCFLQLGDFGSDTQWARLEEFRPVEAG